MTASSLEPDKMNEAESIPSDTMGVPETKFQGDSPRALQQAIDRLTALGTIRDGILVSGAIFYAAGYLVWSSHAWRNNMGILPVLDFQYFVAGFVPVLIVTLAYLVGRFLWHFIMEVWPQKVGADATGGWRTIRLTLRVLFEATLFSLLFMAHPSISITLGFLRVVSVSKRLPIPWITKRHDDLPAKGKVLRGIVTLALLALFVFSLIKGNAINTTFFGFVDRIEDNVTPFLVFGILLSVLFSPMTEKDWIARKLKVFYFALCILFLPLLGLLYYALEVYPNWPQELGGVQPRYAYVDISTETLSEETRAMLLPEQAADVTQGTIRSHRLTVLFSNDIYLLVKPPRQEQRRDARVYELKKGKLKAITWCD